MGLSSLPRTDLALEAADTGDGRLPEGVAVTETAENGVRRTSVRIETPQAARRLGRPRGLYHTLEGPLLAGGALCEQTAALLARLLPEGPVLVAGLGSRAFTADALGPLTADRVLAARRLPDAGEGGRKSRSVCVLAPGSAGQTGLETAAVVAAVAHACGASAVVAVDALAARSARRLGTTVQLSDTGIAPGSGVANRRTALSRETLGVPVVSIGIPTVIDASALLGEKAGAFVVTPREIDRILQNGAQLLAEAINRALQPRRTNGGSW